MNIQQYYEEKERAEQEKGSREQVTGPQPASANRESSEQVIPVVQEQVHISKEEIETAKVLVQTKVVEVEKTIDVPLMKEGYEVERVAMDQLIDTYPQVREEGDRIIIPVVQEVLVVEKRLKLVEEVHLIKRQTTVTRTEMFTLKKEEVIVDRVSADKPNNK